jgi:hypothetical protein
MSYLASSLRCALSIVALSAGFGVNSSGQVARDGGKARESRWVGLRWMWRPGGPGGVVLRADGSVVEGLRVIGGASLDPPPKVEYSLDWVAKADTAMLWLNRVTGYDSSGRHPRWEVRAALVLPARMHFRNDEPVFDDGSVLLTSDVTSAPCEIGGVVDPAAAALVEPEEGDWYTKVRWAWRVNRQLESFDAIPAANVRCHHEHHEK